MADQPKTLNISGIPAPTPSQIREHAPDVGSVFIRIERRGKFEEMSIFNPELLLQQRPDLLPSIMAQIERKLLAIIKAGAKP